MDCGVCVYLQGVWVKPVPPADAAQAVEHADGGCSDGGLLLKELGVSTCGAPSGAAVLLNTHLCAFTSCTRNSGCPVASPAAWPCQCALPVALTLSPASDPAVLMGEGPALDFGGVLESWPSRRRAGEQRSVMENQAPSGQAKRREDWVPLRGPACLQRSQGRLSCRLTQGLQTTCDGAGTQGHMQPG